MSDLSSARKGSQETKFPNGEPRGKLAGSEKNWLALLTVTIGSFMVTIDFFIVFAASPTILTELDTDYHMVIWVTSAYALAYTVPALVVGQLGDRFGVRRMYLIGLVLFTLSSLICGLSDSVTMLIAGRVGQGVGGVVLNTQILSLITRIFAPSNRGMAWGVWGITTGVANLVGPLAGGVLVDTLGWESIFLFNVPIGITGLVLGLWLVPELSTHRRRFDLFGVGLSGVGMFLIVFALQQGQAAGWALWIWTIAATGVGFMTIFIYWQSINTREPLIPLKIFRNRNFAVSSLGGAAMTFSATAMMLPAVFYLQTVRGFSPTRTALLTLPGMIAAILMAPVAGKVADKYHPRSVVGFGFSMVAIGLTWFAIEMASTAPAWQLVLPIVGAGVGMVFVSCALPPTATRSVPQHLAGASASIYNVARALGDVLGAAGIAAFMTSRIGAALSPIPGRMYPRTTGDSTHTALQMPELLREPFSVAMSESMMLPAIIALTGVIAALFLVGPSHGGTRELPD